MPPTKTVDHNGERIRVLRIDQGLTVAELAATVGKSPGTISNIEHGNKRCSETLLNRLAEALGVPPAELMSNEPAEPGALLTIPQAARELDCSGMHVYRLIAEGALRPVDIANAGARASKLRVRRDDLATFIDARTRTAGVAATA